ncbi:unnamed protein product [Caenorhabditis nigoni]
MIRSFFLLTVFSALCLFGTKGTGELRNSTSDFDALLNDTEISTQTMENTNATASLSVNKYFFNMSISNELMTLLFVILLVLLYIILAQCYLGLQYRRDRRRERRLGPRRNVESRSPMLHMADWTERRRIVTEMGIILDC